MKKSTRNILIGSGIAVAGLGAVGAASYVITKKLLQLALDRNAPMFATKGKKKKNESEEMLEISRAVKEAAARLEDCDCEEVTITSHDGLKLVGHWYECPNAKRVVVAMHGWRSSWTYDFGMISEFLHDNGCSVLYAEQRGQNNSEGDHMTFGILERYDCLEWIKWVNEKCGEQLPVYLAGVSMGASTVLMTAGLELPATVRGIITDSAFTSPDAIWKHVAEKNMHIPYELHDTMVDKMCRKMIQQSAKEYSTIDAMRQCKVPVLFIHGTDDSFVPVTMSYENYNACASEKRLFVVPKAEHGLSYYVDTAGYENEVLTFFRKHDN